jgi:A/G-specific adenine glycosylase
MTFQKKLLRWFEENQRPFPWRKNNDPYGVWLSEIILQQTRAAQGLPYFERFMATFPTVRQLAEASEDRVLKLWEGLGYYSRARNLHATAREILYRYEGEFPQDFEEIKRLKGIGDYTASAIASICFGQVQAVVDGNVYRLLSRVFGIDVPIDTSGAHKIFKSKAQSLMKGALPGDFNQAIMEFGALQCVPKNPCCEGCVFKNQCVAFQQGKVGALPVKAKKIKVSQRYLHFFVLTDGLKNTVLEKRENKGIWQNLYQFPLIETKESHEKVENEAYLTLLRKHHVQGTPRLEKWNDHPIIHKLTHQALEIHFWIVHVDQGKPLAISTQSLFEYPMPKVLQNFRDKFFIN